jgi:uncharacterized protein YjdB
MSYIFADLRRVARRWGWLVVCPVIAVCSSETPSATIEPPNPGTVADLAVGATTSATITLSFTQVDDGMGQPANYDIRFAVAPISWGSAVSVASGTCASPFTGTAIGSTVSCTVLGLSPSTSYDFQAKAFRGTMTGSVVFGGPSNVAAASTLSTTPPAPVVTTVTVSPTSASVAVGATTPLTATVKDQNGNVMSGQTVNWSSGNTTAATVNSNGVVTGAAAGSATITATSSGKSGTSAITVTAVPPPAPVVTTVTVSPTSASVAIGATTSLTATVKDQNGNAMSGQTVTWSSGNTAAATVSSSGVVTGVAAGSATITAASSAKTGTSSITVTAVTPPGGGTLLFHEEFEDANIGSRGWYDNTNVLLSTTEHIAGSNSSVQYRFLAGAAGPTSGSAQRHKFTPSNSLYISYYVKYSANWVGSGQSYHPHEFYALSTLDGDYDGPGSNYMTIYLESNYQNGGKPVMSMQDNLNINTSFGTPPHSLIGVTEDRSTGGCNGMAEANMYSECFSVGSSWYNLKQLAGPVVFQPNAGPGYKNSWNFVEAYFQLNTVVGGIGQADGVMQYWFNGTLIIDRHDILFRTGAHPTLQFSQFLIGPYIGDGSPVDQSMWVDNLRAATGRIP